MDKENPTIIDSNGTLYAVGWNDGWFDIEMVERNPFYDEEPDSGQEYVRATDVDGSTYPVTSFTPSGAEKLVEAIQEGR